LDTTWLNGIAQDPLHFYTVATVVFVIVVSALLALVRLPGVWVPIRTWLVMLPLALGALWIGQAAWVLLVTVISLIAFTEFARVTGLLQERPLVAVVYAAIVAENLFAFRGTYNFFMATPMWAILALTLVPIALNRTDNGRKSWVETGAWSSSKRLAPWRSGMQSKLRLVVACAVLTPPLVYVAVWAFGQAQVDWRYKVAGLADAFLGRPAPEMSVIIGFALTAIIGVAALATGLVRWTMTAATDLAGRVLGWSWLLLLIAGWGGYVTGGAIVVAAGGAIDYRANTHWEFGTPLNSAADVPGTCRSVVGQPETVAEVHLAVLGLPDIYLRDVVSGTPVPLVRSALWTYHLGDYPEGSAVFEPPNVPERPRPYLAAGGVHWQPISFVRAYNYWVTKINDSHLSGTAYLTGIRFNDPYGGGDSLYWVDLTIPNDPWPPTYELTVSWACQASST
jgi:hypothetical protein